MIKSKDVERLIDIFCEVAQMENLTENILKLTDYPLPVVQEFVKCMDALGSNKKFTDENYMRENYDAIIAYIFIRLNLVTVEPIEKTKEYEK